MALADPDDPYVTARGKLIIKNEKQEEAIKNKDRFVPVIRRMTILNKRSLGELPSADLPTQTAIMAILGYQLIGLTANEISHALKIPLDEIQNIQFSTDYQNTFELIFGELINVNSNSIKAKIADFAASAVDNIITLANEADKDIVKLKANQDILDRAGFAAENLYGESTADEADILKIVMESDSGVQTKVTLDLGKRKKA